MNGDSKVSINNLPEVQGVAADDFLIVQNQNDTSIVKFENFVLGPDNVNFYETVKTVRDTNSTLLTNSITAVNTLAHLSGYNPGQTGDGTLAYLRERTSGGGTDGGGLFMFDYGESATDNGGTIINPTSTSVTGRWKRINYEFIDPRWFGASTSSSDNTVEIQAAIDYGTSVYKPVKIPNGTFNVDSISASAGAHITGAGNSILQRVRGSRTEATIYIANDNVVIENLEIIGSYNNGLLHNNIGIDGGDDIIIQNCRIQSASANNVVLTNSKRCKVVNNLIYNAGSNNIHIFENSDGVSERNVVCNNIIYTSGALDILEAGSDGSNHPNYNVITSNIADTIADIRITGTNTITALNVAGDFKLDR
jgi:hypothetical protein